MSDRVFQEAYDRVRSRHSPQEWFSMTPREVSEAIFREIRVIDMDRVSQDDQLSAKFAAE
jgi:hypothetical protein